MPGCRKGSRRGLKIPHCRKCAGSSPAPGTNDEYCNSTIVNPMSKHHSNKSLLDEKSFKSTYIATFLASYMANRYDTDCMNGHRGEPYEHQPVEDANFCANCAWQTIQDLL
jgi:hypothetical protein